MVAISYPLHQHTDVQVSTDPVTLFAHLDDHMRLAAHIERPSLMTAGATMHIETDERQGRAVGSIISMHGRVLGLNLRLDEMVIEYDPPRSKVWETRGRPRLLVIGGDRMGFKVAERERGSQLIDSLHQLPASGTWHRTPLGADFRINLRCVVHQKHGCRCRTCFPALLNAPERQGRKASVKIAVNTAHSIAGA